MPMQSRTSLAALMTVSLAAAAPLILTQIDTAWAQSGGGGGSGGGGTGGSAGAGASGAGAGSVGSTSSTGATDRGSAGAGSTAGSAVGATPGTSASDRGGSGTGRTMGDTRRPGMNTPAPGTSNTQPGSMSRDSTGSTMPGGNASTTGRNSSMSGASGNDATMRSGSGVRGSGEDGSLVGTEKLNAALGALDGTSGARTRRGANSARVVQIEEYETAMRNALAIQDPAQRSAAVSEARDRLQRATTRDVSPDVIARVDSILGLPATSTTR